MVPYLQEAGYGFDVESDRDWLLKLAALAGPSLTRLKDCVDLSRFFFTPTMEFADAAAEQLRKEGVARCHAGGARCFEESWGSG